MEYSTFENPSRKNQRKISVKKLLLRTSVAATVALVLLLGYHSLPKKVYDRATNNPLLGTAQEAYKAADENEDGEVEPEEVHNMIEEVMHEERANEPRKMQMLIHGMLPEMVQSMDKNGDGNIDPNEAAKMLGMIPQMMAQALGAMNGMQPENMAPADHAEYMEVQNRVRNEFKDAVLDLALKNHRNESLSKEECFQNCFGRCRWLLDPTTCVDTCNQGCGTDAELFNPMEHARKVREQMRDAVKYGESESNYTLSIKKPGLEAKNVMVEVRGPVLVVRGSSLEQHKYYNITHEFLHSAPIPEDVQKDKITSELEEDVLTIILPKDPELAAKLRADRKQLDVVAHADREKMEKMESQSRRQVIDEI